MRHQIAFSTCWADPLGSLSRQAPKPITCFVASLETASGPGAIQGLVKLYQQSPQGGAWTLVLAPGMPRSLVNSGRGFVSICGLNNILIGLGADGFMYMSTYSQALGWWGGFELIQPAVPPGSPAYAAASISEFSAQVVLFNWQAVLVIAAVASSPGTIGPGGGLNFDSRFFCYTQNLSTQTAGNWSPISVGISNARLPSLGWTDLNIAATGNMGVSLLGASGGQAGPGAIFGWSSSDGVRWNSAIFQNPTQPAWFTPAPVQDILLTVGATGQPNQGIVLSGGQPRLCYDISGSGAGWALYGGSLLPANVVNPPSFLTSAAGLGNGGNLQLVSLGHTVFPGVLPWLLWQDTGGHWHPFPYDPASGEYVNLASNFGGSRPSPIDLAVGAGWTGNQTPTLQVAYLASDGNVYITWQDSQGGWHWYAGISGNGLP